MIRITEHTEELNDRILEFLYRDELMNVLTIHYFANIRSDLGELYILEDNSHVKALLHIKDDGNSHFTTFYVEDEIYLKNIADTLEKLDYKDILLASSDKNIKLLLKHLNVDGDLYLHTYYLCKEKIDLNIDKSEFTFGKVEEKDFEIINEFVIDFFEAKTIEAKERIVSKLKKDKIRILFKGNVAIGFGVFFGYSENYIDISSVYIAKEYRGLGYSKILMDYMLDEARNNGKLPILQASLENIAANSLYKKIGFEKVCKYAFQFVNKT